MPRGLGNDDDWQRHNANRNGQEGRNQDRTNYEIGKKKYRDPKQYRDSGLYIQLSGRGPKDGAWVSEDTLKREYPAVYKKMLRQG